MITPRTRGIWRAALTLANNLCVRRSDETRADYGPTEVAHALSEQAQEIRGWMEPSDRALEEMLSEALVPADTALLQGQELAAAVHAVCDPLFTASDGGDMWLSMRRRPGAQAAVRRLKEALQAMEIGAADTP